jgi:hypothetical protein
MERLDREAARRRGQRKLEEMRRRATRLRWRVVATALVGFAALWTVVFVQMATGNDPALGTGKAARAAAKKQGALNPQRHNLGVTGPPPPRGEEDDDGPAVEGPEAGETGVLEAERAEAERIEAEQLEIERQEAEARELEELEPLSTGQS